MLLKYFVESESKVLSYFCLNCTQSSGVIVVVFSSINCYSMPAAALFGDRRS